MGKSAGKAAMREIADRKAAERKEARRQAERRVVERWGKHRDVEQIARETGVSLDGPKDRGDGKPAVWKKKRRKQPLAREISTGFETSRRRH
jgi:hypothetical protein